VKLPAEVLRVLINNPKYVLAILYKDRGTGVVFVSIKMRGLV
jgi:hypothetical protein